MIFTNIVKNHGFCGIFTKIVENHERYVKKHGTARNDKKPNFEIIINLLKEIFKKDRK